MSERSLHKIVIFLAVLLIGIGLYFYATTDRNIFTAIFLRAGCIFFLASCFWKWIIRIPSWAQIGWLPIVAAIIAWKPFLLKFAIPTSIVLVFLNSPLARGSYKKKNWHDLSKAFPSTSSASSQSKPEAESAPKSESKPELEHKTVVEVLTKPDPKPEPEAKSEKKEKKPLYGPNAQNTMFRALSRVAGRQVGKMMKKKEKK
ncbi:MAG: hypothetical protein K6C40_13300 [Thermoguttaceae bacterium]|nr:hypothetical protein [Thermoguttaceae bacterium]